jgi:hypothetical protein
MSLSRKPALSRAFILQAQEKLVKETKVLKPNIEFCKTKSKNGLLIYSAIFAEKPFQPDEVRAGH